MFWGCTIKKGQDYKHAPEEVDQSILHVSNAALGFASKGKATVVAKVDGKEFVLTHLENGKAEHTTLDLYFRDDQEVSFLVKGEAEVHLSGYYEPSHEDGEDDLYGGFPDEDDEDDEDIDEEEEDDEEEEEAPKAKV